MADLELTSQDQAMLDGAHGPAAQMAMRILTTMARVFDAPMEKAMQALHHLLHKQQVFD